MTADAPSEDPHKHFEFGVVPGMHWPVAFMRALVPGAIMALDFFVDGLKAKAHRTAGYFWIDLCDRDPRNNPDADQRRMRIGIGKDAAHIGSSKQDNAKTCPVELRVDDKEVGRLTERGLQTSLLMNFGAAVPIKTVSKGVVTVERTLFRITTPDDDRDLHTFEGGEPGDMIAFRPMKPVTIKHGTGNILNASDADYGITSASQMLVYFKEDDGHWRGGKMIS